MASRRPPASTTSTSKSSPQKKAAAPAEPVTVPPKATAEAVGTAAAPAPKKAASRAKRTVVARPAITEDVRRGMIAKAAYYRAEKRGFATGYEDEDWLAAEAEVDALLSADQRAPQ